MSMKANTNRLFNRLRLRAGYNYRDKNSFNYRKQLSRIIICIVIVIAIIILKKIDIGFTNKIIRIVEDTLNYTYDIKEDSIEVYNYVKDKLKISDEVIPVYMNDVSLSEKQIHFIFSFNRFSKCT